MGADPRSRLLPCPGHRGPGGARLVGHFFLGAVDLTDDFASAARELGEVLLLAGPLGLQTSLPDLDGEDADVLDLLSDRLVPLGPRPVTPAQRRPSGLLLGRDTSRRRPVGQRVRHGGRVQFPAQRAPVHVRGHGPRQLQDPAHHQVVRGRVRPVLPHGSGGLHLLGQGTPPRSGPGQGAVRLLDGGIDPV